MGVAQLTYYRPDVGVAWSKFSFLVQRRVSLCFEGIGRSSVERPQTFNQQNIKLRLFLLLPARASEQGNVIGLVSMSSKKNCNWAN